MGPKEVLAGIDYVRYRVGNSAIAKRAMVVIDALTSRGEELAIKLVDAEKNLAQATVNLEAHREQLAKPCTPTRTRLPETRHSLTRRWRLTKPPRQHVCPACNYRYEETDEQKVYATVGLYPDGRPGEVFIVADRAGSTARGALDAAAMFLSIGLQYGVPLSTYVDKVIGSRYGAGGITGDREYPQTGSVLDLVGRWMRDKWCLGAVGK